jgi:RHS repeat-associated protein
MWADMPTTAQSRYRAKYYDPSIGQFLSEDPLGFDGDGPNLLPTS